MTLRLGMRQAAALARLLVRYWLRAGMPGSRIDRLRKGSALVVRLAMLVLYWHVGRLVGQASLRNAENGRTSVEWLVAGLVGFAVCWGMLTRARSLRGMALPLASPFLDSLPLRDASRTTLELLEVLVAHIFTASAFHAASPALSPLASVGLGLATSVAAATWGAALMRGSFVVLRPERSVTLTQLVAGGQALFIAAAFIAPAAELEVSPWFFACIARPMAGEGGLAVAFLFAAAAVLVGALLIAWAEWFGYDRVEVVPEKRYVRAAREMLTIGAVDALLARREPGSRRWPVVAVGVLIVAGLGALLIFVQGSASDEILPYVPAFLVPYSAWMVIVTGATTATRAVTRDLVARPFLASLPVGPNELLAGKAAVVRRHMLLGLFPLAFALLAPFDWDTWWQLAWRSATAVAGTWIYAGAAVSVAFLTGGMRTARPQPGGTFRLETLLLLTPLAAILLAPSPWMTLVPLAALALVAFEARRNALRVAEWLDDGEDFDRETASWRAALTFAAFQGAQLLIGRIVQTWASDLGLVLAASYISSAVLLAGLTLYGRRDLPAIRVWPRWRVTLLLAALGGVMTAGVGFATARWLLPEALRGLDVDLLADPAGQIAFAITIVAVAPLVEELFFRSWLQHAIMRELQPKRAWVAAAIAALAFATVHPAPSFPAVFVLGLLTGALYAKTGSLAPCVIAHAVHNSVVVFLG